jgi:hypothetical protein
MPFNKRPKFDPSKPRRLAADDNAIKLSFSGPTFQLGASAGYAQSFSCTANSVRMLGTKGSDETVAASVPLPIYLHGDDESRHGCVTLSSKATVSSVSAAASGTR